MLDFLKCLERQNYLYTEIQKQTTTYDDRHHYYTQLYALKRQQEFVNAKLPYKCGFVTAKRNTGDCVYFQVQDEWYKIDTSLFYLERCYITDYYQFCGILYIVYQDGYARKIYTVAADIEKIENDACIPEQETIYYYFNSN
ncbi:hypothetical protein SEPL_288 [Salmonella phage SE_PL]|uniref:hypothetical protein n=1 Tax=Salmonella enterica TaxID=28901 RepID=UPI000FDF70ED|nr:hypothetical protein CPT_Munch_137 [Salmonella phage Munch]EAZ2022929.1 hypothetical protein [Salmonella enterica]ECV9084063.1 hypothetical protein [Salmonella enterica subsp. enterica serovar Infantis]MCP0435835.1 hypothetical protein [Salmonella enterica subsp. enterica serovar Mbandaka]QCW18817.1 hypothetical protein 7t3_0296 [Salmonella phage 7t3]QIG62901.1 hypothetical protein SEPL_288 [Salmonella phage SE_PL]